MLKGFTEELIFVCNTSLKLTGMDKVKRSAKQPRRFVVINFKLAIWRDPILLASQKSTRLGKFPLPGRLYWAQVCPNYLSRRVFAMQYQ